MATVVAPTAGTRFTIVTSHGYVQFVAADEWSVIGSQSKMPVAFMGFQIPDPADEGTNDSTNLAVFLYDQNTPKGQRAMQLVGKKYGSSEPSVTRQGDWKVFEQRATQGATEYIVLDAIRPVADITASVRLAWPRLPGHRGDFDARMRETFSKTLNSFRGGLGPYKPGPDDVVRRPKR